MNQLFRLTLDKRKSWLVGCGGVGDLWNRCGDAASVEADGEACGRCWTGVPGRYVSAAVYAVVALPISHHP